MSGPTTIEEFIVRHRAGEDHDTSDGGLVTTMPCPFCAAPKFASYEPLRAAVTLATEHVCSECGRGAAVVTKMSEKGKLQRSLEQTRGDPPSPFIPERWAFFKVVPFPQTGGA